MTPEYIGITSNRLEHSIAVARKCYMLAKTEYEMSEEEARKMFLMGFIHDMGYEFANNSTQHPNVMGNILDSMSSKDWHEILFAIQTHGKPQKFIGTPEQAILNEADLTVNHTGETVSFEERCASVRKCYGENSHQYYNSTQMVEALKDYKARNNAQRPKGE